MWAALLTPIGPKFAAPIPKPTKHQQLTHFPTNVCPRLCRKAAASKTNAKQEEGKEISGSDVLWALQRAAAQKKKSKTKKKGLASSEASRREKDGDGIDYSNVRPLEIKSEWGLMLDELEKRLQELEQAA